VPNALELTKGKAAGYQRQPGQYWGRGIQEAEVLTLLLPASWLLTPEAYPGDLSHFERIPQPTPWDATDLPRCLGGGNIAMAS
jgi:hypothetical protein